MSVKKNVLTTVLAISSTQALTNYTEVFSVDQLAEIGVDSNKVVQEFKSIHNIDIEEMEKIYVRTDEEGKHIEFQTFDDFVIDIDINFVAAPWNKSRTSTF